MPNGLWRKRVVVILLLVAGGIIVFSFFFTPPAKYAIILAGILFMLVVLAFFCSPLKWLKVKDVGGSPDVSIMLLLVSVRNALLRKGVFYLVQ